MPVNDKPRNPRPNPFRTILLLLPLGLLVLNLVLTFGNGPRVSKVPYSFFIEQVQDEQVSRVSVGQNVIRYQIKDADGNPGQVQETTPIFDLELPKLLESKGVEFAATPPPANRWFTTLLSWVIPPVIFVAIFQFFSRGGLGGWWPSRCPLCHQK